MSASTPSIPAKKLPSGGRLRVLAVSAALPIWFIGLLVIGSSLLARHTLALPRPSFDGRLPGALANLASTDPRGASLTGAAHWAAFHVLYSDCRCSARIAEHLANSERPAGVRETVLFVGHDETFEGPLRARGFRVEEISADALSRDFGIDAAPLFVVQDARGGVRYVGGYTEEKQGIAAKDRDILRELTSGRPVTQLPVTGCAVSQELRAKTNPLGLP